MKNQKKKAVLPAALRDDEITETDVTVLLRVAQDKKAPAGRYKRTPKKLPNAKPSAVVKK